MTTRECVEGGGSCRDLGQGGDRRRCWVQGLRCGWGVGEAEAEAEAEAEEAEAERGRGAGLREGVERGALGLFEEERRSQGASRFFSMPSFLSPPPPSPPPASPSPASPFTTTSSSPFPPQPPPLRCFFLPHPPFLPPPASTSSSLLKSPMCSAGGGLTRIGVSGSGGPGEGDGRSRGQERLYDLRPRAPASGGGRDQGGSEVSRTAQERRRELGSEGVREGTGWGTWGMPDRG
eukprot:102615-Rhodomonas_salina.1